MSETRYCVLCNEEQAEWDIDYEGSEACPDCSSVLYDSEEAYVQEMIRWLDERFDWSEEDVRDFLLDNENPGKGQALVYISRKERREGRYIQE